MAGKIRILIARLGLDAHWRGSIVVARALRDAGMEVIYVGNQRPEAIVKAAVEENVDFVGLSTLSGNHMELVPEVVRLMREAGVPDIPVLLGGTVPPDDVPKLKDIGVDGIFGPGTALKDIVKHITRGA
jgi:methylmalonyl-CoA mutase, C-terminal domain